MSDGTTPLVHVLGERARATPEALAYAVYPRGARSEHARITWGELYQSARALAARLLAAHVQPGDRVVVHSGNTPLWPIADLAVQMIGAIGVGIYPSSAAAQTEALLADALPVAVFAGSPSALRDVRSAQVALGAHFSIVGAGEPDGDWMSWCAEGARLLASENAIGALDARTNAVRPDDIAALIYTSGSTGVPKGAQISHRCLAASAASIATLSTSDSMVSFLPFSHAAERIFGQCTRIHVGMPSALVEDPADVFAVCQDFEPTLFGGLPRIFERMHEAAGVARADGRDPRQAITDRVGTRCRIATSGGAVLPVRVAQELEALGLPVLGAYGQTEHLCIAMNRPRDLEPDSVGYPMPGTELRIAGDGEVLVARSALTFSGYFGKPDETAAAFTADGLWLHTGDLGALDDNGRLRITGRSKELIALSNGRKIAPLPIEAALTSHPLIAHAVCHGESRKYLVALLSLRQDAVRSWARTHDVHGDWTALVQHPALRRELQQAVHLVNAGLARTDEVKAFAVTETEFTEANGLLTPTMKIMRRAVHEQFAAQLDALYAN